MNLYKIDKLMASTRVLASNYYALTGKTLAISSELAKYDYERLRSNFPSESFQDLSTIIIKAKVLFKPRLDTKIGKINFKTSWRAIVLVLYQADYLPKKIYSISRSNLEITESGTQELSFSIAKFSKIANLVWSEH